MKDYKEKDEILTKSATYSPRYSVEHLKWMWAFFTFNGTDYEFFKKPVYISMTVSLVVEERLPGNVTK
jgi:hypothetical protein